MRADLLRSSVAMARERPLTGFGLGAWPSAYPGYALYDDGTFVNQAHNDWAQWTVEGGLPLLLAMLAVVGAAAAAGAGLAVGVGADGGVRARLGGLSVRAAPGAGGFLFRAGRGAGGYCVTVYCFSRIISPW